MADSWRDYQEEAAEFFRSIGLKATTDAPIQGIRTKHDVDVLVEIDLAGWSVRWIVECKHWKTPVSKLHVLGLREIVSEVGADRGIILCEKGFQSGAIEAANLTNVQVTSLEELGQESREAIAGVRLKDLFDRVSVCRQRYWDTPKPVRIDHKLRPGLFDPYNYSGDRVILFCEKYLGAAFRGQFPINVDELDVLLLGREIPASLESAEHVFLTVDPVVSELEAKLDSASEWLENNSG